MALQLEQQHRGTPCNYWKILSFTSNNVKNVTHVILGLYVNKESRDTSIDNYFIKENHTVQGSDLKLEDIYPKLKEDIVYPDNITESKFKNAADV